MRMRMWLVAGSVSLVLSACGGAGSSTSTPAPPPATAAPASPSDPAPSATGSQSVGTGQYISEEQYLNAETVFEGAVVLFFSADDCPECVQTDRSLTDQGVPTNFTIVKVDMDSGGPLPERYDVTEPGTFVQVDVVDEEVGRWTGTTTGAEIEAAAQPISAG